jgi:hypothetical protein
MIQQLPTSHKKQKSRRGVLAGIDSRNVIAVDEEDASDIDGDEEDNRPKTRHATRQAVNGRRPALYDAKVHPMDEYLRSKRRTGQKRELALNQNPETSTDEDLELETGSDDGNSSTDNGNTSVPQGYRQSQRIRDVQSTRMTRPVYNMNHHPQDKALGIHTRKSKVKVGDKRKREPTSEVTAQKRGQGGSSTSESPALSTRKELSAPIVIESSESSDVDDNESDVDHDTERSTEPATNQEADVVSVFDVEDTERALGQEVDDVPGSKNKNPEFEPDQEADGVSGSDAENTISTQEPSHDEHEKSSTEHPNDTIVDDGPRELFSSAPSVGQPRARKERHPLGDVTAKALERANRTNISNVQVANKIPPSTETARKAETNSAKLQTSEQSIDEDTMRTTSSVPKSSFTPINTQIVSTLTTDYVKEIQGSPSLEAITRAIPHNLQEALGLGPDETLPSSFLDDPM